MRHETASLALRQPSSKADHDHQLRGWRSLQLSATRSPDIFQGESCEHRLLRSELPHPCRQRMAPTSAVGSSHVAESSPTSRHSPAQWLDSIARNRRLSCLLGQGFLVLTLAGPAKRRFQDCATGPNQVARPSRRVTPVHLSNLQPKFRTQVWDPAPGWDPYLLCEVLSVHKRLSFNGPDHTPHAMRERRN